MNKYHEYRDSGIFWIGDIPSHWDVKKLKYLASVVLSSVDRHEHENELSVSICHYPDVYYREFIDKRTSLPSGTCSLAEFEKFRLLKGDVILTKDSETQDDIGVPTYVTENVDNAVCGYHLAQLRMQSKVLTDLFTYRFLQSTAVKYFFCISAKGITRYALGKRFIENLFVVIPPVIEQRRISSYLNKKTKQIDSLVAKIRKKVELLQEQRTSLIQHCVTKGLNPDAEMKDSGLEWIGEIPKHWMSCPVKYIGEITLGKMLTPTDMGNMSFNPYLRSVNVQENYLDITNLNEMWFSNTELEKLSLKRGDILINEGGQVGRPCFVDNDIPGIAFQNSINRIRAENVDSNYLFFLILSNFKFGYYESIVERVSIPHLTKEKLENSIVVVPPIEEQKNIVRYINKKTRHYDGLLDLETKKINLLSVYRQSLISNAVTGKIRITEEMI